MSRRVQDELGRLVEAMPTQREADYAELVWRAGRRRRRIGKGWTVFALLLGTAGLLWAVSVLGGPYTSGQAPAGSVRPAASNTSGDSRGARLAEVRAELAAHPTWPQRQITMQDGFLVLPYGVGDPQGYLAWTEQLGERYAGQVRRAYVQEPGAPSLAELDAIKEQVSRDLRGLDALPAYSLGTRPQLGRVELQYQPTADTAFLAVVARAEAAYGDRLHAEATDDYPKPAAALITKGGYGTTAWSGVWSVVYGCTIGFNVIKNGVYHFLTAAHCAQGDGFSGSALSPYFYSWGGGQTPHYIDAGRYLGQVSASFHQPAPGRHCGDPL